MSWAVPEAFLEDMQHNVKKHEKTQREKTGFHGILGPGREGKIDKNRVRGRSSRSRRPFLAVFSRFFRRRARKSTFAPTRSPFWDPPTSRKCSKYYGFGTFSRFQKKTEKPEISTWKFNVFWPIRLQKASQKNPGPTGRIFLEPKLPSGFSPFFGAPSLPKKIEKRAVRRFAPKRSAVCRRPPGR